MSDTGLTTLVYGKHEIVVDFYMSVALESKGKFTLHIDTTDFPDGPKGPALRVVLNDDFEDPIWDGDVG